MTRATTFAVAVLASSILCLEASSALAEPPNAKATPLYILSLWTEDADDPADALTQALRARVREAPGWSLAETSQSFETLSIALRCPPRPDAPCLQRIGDQLHADHYVWGTLAKDKPGQVTANVHLWSRSKPESEASESYSENLKDPNDDSLRAVGARLFARLTGVSATGTLVVHAGTGTGAVLVDSSEKGRLDTGLARMSVTAGPHTVTVRVAGFEAAPQTANVTAGNEQDLNFALTPAGKAVAGESEVASSSQSRRVFGYAAIVAGAGLVVAGGVEALGWLNDKNDSDRDRSQVPRSVSDVCANPVNAAAQDACDKSRSAITASTLGWIFAAAGAVLAGAGVWLVTSEPEAHPNESAARVPNSRLQVIPALGAHAGEVSVRLAF
jgi:hypothetical protein